MFSAVSVQAKTLNDLSWEHHSEYACTSLQYVLITQKILISKKVYSCTYILLRPHKRSGPYEGHGHSMSRLYQYQIDKNMFNEQVFWFLVYFNKLQFKNPMSVIECVCDIRRIVWNSLLVNCLVFKFGILVKCETILFTAIKLLL